VDDTRPERYLEPTEFIESAAAPIVALARSLAGTTERETAVALFDWVRDRVKYDPYAAMDPREQYKATAVLERERGYCVQKAVLLAALGRAAGIPTRLGFADVRNHKSPPRMLELMGTNLFVFHGFVEFYLGGEWVKATPAFDETTSRKAGVLPVELDGEHDAMFHPVDPEGHPFIEYVRSRGSHADLPFDELRRTLVEVYGGGRRDHGGAP
jgi:transglutaminase-like putative cysteine protease